MQHQVSAIPLCRAPFPVGTGVLETAVGLGRRRRQVFVKRLRLRGRAAPGAEAKNFHNLGFGLFHKCQNIARPHSAGGFTDGRAAHPDFTSRHNPGGDAARLVKPRMPKPFIQPDRVAGLIRQSRLRPMRAAAKGLSGSIFFSCFGFASNRCGLSRVSGLPRGLPLPRGFSPRGLSPWPRGVLA